MLSEDSQPLLETHAVAIVQRQGNSALPQFGIIGPRLGGIDYVPEDLQEWTECSRMDNYKRTVIAPLHKSRLIEWDKATDAAIISPSGIVEVENQILKLGDASRVGVCP